MKVLIFVVIIILGLSHGVEIIEDKNIQLNLSPKKVWHLNKGYIVLEYPDYELILDTKRSTLEETHLKCDINSGIFLQKCANTILKEKIKGLIETGSKNVRYFKLPDNRYGICSETGIYIIKNNKVYTFVQYRFPSFISDCSFSSDGKYAVFSYGKNYFEFLINTITLGSRNKSNFELVLLDIEKGTQKTLLKSYKFLPFYNPVFSLDNKKIFFSADRLKNFKDKGLYSINIDIKKVEYETFFTAPNITTLPDNRLLICDINQIYIYDPEEKKKLLIFTLDRDCSQYIHYVKDLNR